MLNPELLTPPQQKAIDRLYEHDHTLLVANMGSGKTVVALTAIEELLRRGEIRRVLVVAPLKVCNTVWAQEAAGWSHLQGLTIAVATGSEAKRRAALDSGAQITCINFENLPWLFRTYKAKKIFDGLVVDELSKLKSVGGAQFKALRPRLNDFTWRVGMTGTPVSEDWTGLFGQMLVVDSGARLGTRKDGYLRKYFYATDYMEYNWALHDWAPAAIGALISDVVYTMPDYRHELPPITYRTVELELTDDHRRLYDDLRRDMAAAVGGGEVAADSAAVLSNKLLQCANGFLYGPADPVTGAKDTHLLSGYKLNAVFDEVKEGGDGPVMICYWYGADLARLKSAFPHAPYELTDKVVDQWNAGELPVLLLHPRSAGHGLNLARGGHRVLWLGPVWSRDLWEQTNARLWRRGQKSPVEVVTLIGSGTIDGLVVDRVEEKGAYEELFKLHLGA